MTTLYRAAALLGFVFLSACGGGSGETANEPQVDFRTAAERGISTNIAYQLVDADYYSGIDTEQTAVIQDAFAWAALWQEHKKNRFPPPPLPAIDFSQHVILGVFLGSRPNGCFSVEIERVYLQQGTMFVEYTAAPPPPEGAACTQSITAPSQLVTVPRLDRPVRFLKVS